MKNIFSEHSIRLAFEISLLLKAVFACLEMLAGIGAYLVSQHFLVAVARAITASELSEDPRDFIASYLVHWAQNLSISAQHFAALYLLSHGAVKLWLIVGLLRERLWYYPVALVVFWLFIAYQLYRYPFTHSAFLLLLTALDLIVIALTWHEWRYLRRVAQCRPPQPPPQADYRCRK